MSMKGVVESSQLSKDESLTPSILWEFDFFEGGLKIRKSAKFGFLDSVFLSKREGGNPFQRILLRSLQAGDHFKIILVQIRSVQPYEKNCPG